MTDNITPPFTGYRFNKSEHDLAKLWEVFIQSQRDAEAWKVANGVYNVNEMPSRAWLDREAEKQLNEHI